MRALAGVLLLASSMAAYAAESAYTKVDFEKDCREVETDELGGTWICRGYGGYEIRFAEGDLRQRISAPVRQGDALLKVARIDRLYVEVEVHERDVQDVLGAKAAEIAFVAQPRSSFEVNVSVVEPSAQPKEEGNVFRLRASLASKPAPWFRPGMSGVCKVPSGNRTLAWILAHRTIDFLRMYLWW